MGSPLRFPSSSEEFNDFELFFEDHILHGLKPDAPFLEISDSIISVGSCFARNIHNALVQEKVHGSIHFDIAEASNSPMSLDKFLEIIMFAGAANTQPSEKDLEWATRFVRNIDVWEAAKAVRRAKCAIITVGVAVAKWGSDGYPTHVTIHKSQLMDQQANYKLISRCVSYLRKINPDIHVVLTVSPVPIAGSTFKNLNAFTLDCISKSFLRSAVHMVMSDHMKHVYYWPSFEAVRWFSGHADIKFGDFDGMARHISPDHITQITKIFIKNYFSPV